jgi:hypothetical protein
MPSSAPASPLNDLARRIRELLATGDLDEALDHLRALSLNGPPNLAGEAILLAGRRSHSRREERKGVVTGDQANVTRARIADDARNFLDELERKLSSADAPVPAPAAPSEVFAGTEMVGSEKILGMNNLRQVAWLELALLYSRSVCRVLTPGGLGTGFLIGPQTLMTNNHVIPTVAVAGKTKAEFNYQLPFRATALPSNSARYDLDPAAFFRTDSVLLHRSSCATAGGPEDAGGLVVGNPTPKP